MFPVRCRVVQGLGMSVMAPSGGGAVVLMPGAGAGFNLQAQPGYVGNNPINPMARPMSAFEMYNPAAAMQQRQQQEQRVIIPRRPEDMNPPVMPPPRPPRAITEPKIYIHQPPPPRVEVMPPVVTPPPPVVTPPPPVITSTVTPPPPVTTPPPAPSNYEQAQQAHAIVQAAQQQLPAAEAPKSSGTATAVGIGAAGILAALLFK